MTDDSGQPNGAATGVPPPEGSISILIRLTPSPQGYGVVVQTDPINVFPDTIIEACDRVQRMLNRMLDTQHIVHGFQNLGQETANFNREQERIRRSIGGLRP